MTGSSDPRHLDVHAVDVASDDDTEASIFNFISSSEGARLKDTNPKVFAVLASALNNNFKLPGILGTPIGNPDDVISRPTRREPDQGVKGKWRFGLDGEKRKKVAAGLAFLVGIIFLAVFRDLVYQLTMWLEGRHPVTVGVFCIFIYAFLSLPMTFGYIVVNMAAGYIFGVFIGTLVTVVTVGMGVAIAHLVMKCYFKAAISAVIAKALPASYHNALFKVLGGPEALKIVFLTRLTPIPFGLQNAIFAATNVTTKSYLYATVAGLFPTQCLNVYLGSTLRSLGDILSEGGLSLVGYVVLLSQAGISMALMWMVLRKAKAELMRAVYSYDVEARPSSLPKPKRRVIWA